MWERESKGNLWEFVVEIFSSNLSNLLVKIFYRNKPGGLSLKLHSLVQGREP